ncbi:MAG: 5-oxoprolinase subunit PxpB [Oligoflexales bacterium]|nr:5-oxoprolinase subunit PxpB [Oligoflexales bacterium]
MTETGQKGFELNPLGDSAITISFGREISMEIHNCVRSAAEYFENNPHPAMIECVPAFTSLTIYYDPVKVFNAASDRQAGFSPYDSYCLEIKKGLASLAVSEPSAPRVVTIPVCYGGECGPDIQEVASHAGITPDEVARLHFQSEYFVYMIGFAPGFPYLGGLPEEIAAPRKKQPRVSIPEGSVGIAGKQTGVYPISTPGGWQIIGRTPMKLFRPDMDPPSMLKAGDKVRFMPITLKAFNLAKGEVAG